MIQVNDKAECVGCSACVSVCPRNCIEMKEDREGFLYPRVRKSQCIHCGLCEKVCPTQKSYCLRKEPLHVYAAINNSDAIRERSSSGGVFYTLAEYVIEHNGVVYGATFNENWEVHHIEIESIENISLLQGSKYVQSKIEDCYCAAEKNLKIGKLVLFSGTPCQNAGLRAFLRKDYNNLYCVDIICHGVPSPKVWRYYIDMIVGKGGKRGTVITPSFRSKTKGWNNFALEIPLGNGGKYSQDLNEDLYLKTFLLNIDLRPSCYNCKFKPSINFSDLVIADFWEIENISPEMFDDKGTSLIIFNSDRGRELFENIQEKFTFKQESYAEAIKGNPSSVTSVRCPKNRKSFFFWLNITRNIGWLMKRATCQATGNKFRLWARK